MLGHLKSVMIVSILLAPFGLYAQEMGEEDSSMAENDSIMHEMPMEMSAGERFESEGDAYRDEFNSEMALQSYLNANKEDSSNATYIWKIVREYTDMGVFAESKDETKAHYTDAEKWARGCVSMFPENADCHLFLAVAVGKVALISGKKKMVRLSREVKEESTKAIELNPNLDGSYHVLARWNRKVANLSWFSRTFAKIIYGGLPSASNEDAVMNFEKAIDLRPDRMLHYFELGITYKELGEKAKAREAFEKCLSMEVAERQDAGRQEKAEKFLKKL